VAFANLRFWQGIGYVIVFAWGPFFDFEVKCILLAGVLFVGLVCLITLHVKVIPIDYQGSPTEACSTKSFAKEEEEEEEDNEEALWLGHEQLGKLGMSAPSKHT